MVRRSARLAATALPSAPAATGTARSARTRSSLLACCVTRLSGFAPPSAQLRKMRSNSPSFLSFIPNLSL